MQTRRPGDIQDDQNKRGEIKLTGTVACEPHDPGRLPEQPARHGPNTSGVAEPGHRSAQPECTEQPAELVLLHELPRRRSAAALLVEGAVSRSGISSSRATVGTSTNIVDSPFYRPQLSRASTTRRTSTRTDPEQRNNRQLTAERDELLERRRDATRPRAATSSSAASERAATRSRRRTYVFNTDFLTERGRCTDPRRVRDDSSRSSCLASRRSTSTPATRGAALNVDNNSALLCRTTGRSTARWSADLGARFEHVNAVSTRRHHQHPEQPHRAAPRHRVGPQGNGRHIVHVTYGQYSGRYNEAQVGNNSPVGNPADIFSLYQGPAGQGISFAAGNRTRRTIPFTPDNASVIVPTANVFTDPTMTSPLVHEFSTSLRRQHRQRQGLRRSRVRLPQDHQHHRGLLHPRRRHDERGGERHQCR